MMILIYVSKLYQRKQLESTQRVQTFSTGLCVSLDHAELQQYTCIEIRPSLELSTLVLTPSEQYRSCAVSHTTDR